MRRLLLAGLSAALLLGGAAWAIEGQNLTFGLVANDPLTSLLAGTDGAQRVEYMTILPDVDNDGAPEIICAPRLGGASPQGARLEIYEATADNTYAQTWTWDGESATYYRSNVVASADLDGNGTDEILMGVNSNVTDVLAVFENTGNNTFAAPRLYTWIELGGIDPGASMDFASVVAAGDFDGDGDDEVMLCNTNTQDAIIIASVASGTFAADNVVWTAEFQRNWESSNKGSPYAAVVGNIDNDAQTDIAVVCWDNLRVDLYEATGANTYVLRSETEILTSDDYSWYAADLTDIDGDGNGELWILDIIDSNVYAAEITDCATVTPASFASVFDLTGKINMDQGDQDHGTASDGLDLYITGGMPEEVIDLEYVSGDPLSAANWAQYTLPTGVPSDDTLWMVEAPESDLDGDTLSEIVFTRQDVGGTRVGGVASAPTLYVFEWINYTVTSVRGFEFYR